MADLTALLRMLKADDPEHPINETVGKMLARELKRLKASVSDLNVVVGEIKAPEQPANWRTPENEETWEEFVEELTKKEAAVDAEIGKRKQAAEELVRTAQAIYDDYQKRGLAEYQAIKRGEAVKPLDKVIPPRKDTFGRNQKPTVPPRNVPFYQRKKPNG